MFAKTLQSHKNMGKVTRLNRTTILLDLVVLLNSFTLLVGPYVAVWYLVLVSMVIQQCAKTQYSCDV